MAQSSTSRRVSFYRRVSGGSEKDTSYGPYFMWAQATPFFLPSGLISSKAGVHCAHFWAMCRLAEARVHYQVQSHSTVCIRTLYGCTLPRSREWKCYWAEKRTEGESTPSSGFSMKLIPFQHSYVDQSPIVARRLGFPALPLAVLVALIGSQSVGLAISTQSLSPITIVENVVDRAKWITLFLIFWFW